MPGVDAGGGELLAISDECSEGEHDLCEWHPEACRCACHEEWDREAGGNA